VNYAFFFFEAFTEGGLLWFSFEGTSSQITLWLCELLKITFEFLRSTTTSRKTISVPLGETFEPFSNAAIKESAEYVRS